MEEDAYAYLHAALESQWNKSELEARVAERLEQQRAGGDKVVTLPEIVSVLYQLGVTVPGDHFAGGPSRKLYRQPSDKVIAGVCSGLGEYFGIDPVAVRVLFLVAFFLGLLGFWLYLALWIVVPNTPVAR
jgi:phage shock protein PspC (stress-responsive transcriptional regulator)